MRQVEKLLTTDEMIDYITTLLAYGYSEREIAKILDISDGTIRHLKKKYPEIAKAFEYAKVRALKSFLESARKKLEGERVVEEQTTETYRVRDGVQYLVLVEKKRQERYIPPDTGFMQFWAKSIFKDRFVDEHKVVLEGTAKFIEVEKVYAPSTEEDPSRGNNL